MIKNNFFLTCSLLEIKKTKTSLGKGFTLIEILVTITLIGIIAGVLLTSLQGVRASARDAQRKADLETIQSALAMYKSTCGKYPASVISGTSLVSSGSPGENCVAGVVFLTMVPKDPIATQNYTYSSPTKITYTISALMESGQIMQVTPLTTTYFTPTATPIPTATQIPTATPTICPLLPIGGNCRNDGDAACCSGYCGNGYKCAIHP